MRLTPCILSIALLVACVASGQTTQPSDKVDSILELLQQAGDGLHSIRTDLKYTIKDLIRENPDDPYSLENKYGEIRWLRQGEQTLCYVHFEKSDDGVRINRKQTWLIFDGQWLTEVQEKTKQVTKRQLVRQNEHIDPFKLGEGPIPIPFGQSKQDILTEFEVEHVPHAAGDPQDSAHLQCTPREGSPMNSQFRVVHLYVSTDPKSQSYGLPVRIVADDKREATLKTVEFLNMQKNPGLSPTSDFDTPSRAKNWPVQIERLDPVD